MGEEVQNLDKEQSGAPYVKWEGMGQDMELSRPVSWMLILGIWCYISGCMWYIRRLRFQLSLSAIAIEVILPLTVIDVGH